MMESLPVEMRRMIMEHFSISELLTISLVNKLFNYEARSLMRDRGNLTANLHEACHSVGPFLSDLAVMNLVPFTGVKITSNPFEHLGVCPQPNKILEPSLLDGLHRMPLRRLSVQFHGGNNRYEPKKCPAMQLVKEILKHFSGVLEELELNNHRKSLQLIQQVIQDSTFPRLKIFKTIELHDSNFNRNGDRIENNFIKEVAASAPNLQEFLRDEYPDLSENPLEASSAALVINCDVNIAEFELLAGYTGTLKLTNIMMDCLDFFAVESYKRTLPRIFQSSFDTLQILELDLVLLVPLMGYGVSFKNLTHFSTAVDYASLELADPRILSMLKQFDFTQTFPKLDKIRITSRCSSQDLVTEFVDKAIAMLKEPQPDRAVNIKHLSPSGALTAEAVPFFAAMFPNVDKISTFSHEGEQHEVPYGLIWEYWPELKDLGVCDYTSMNENLDGVLCGIFPQEVALLRDQDDEYLRAVNIVPVMPSLTCQRALRTFRHNRRHDRQLPTMQLVPWFSKVTALIAFQRCPNLYVSIQTNVKRIFEELDPLSPYASVKLYPFGQI